MLSSMAMSGAGSKQREREESEVKQKMMIEEVDEDQVAAALANKATITPPATAVLTAPAAEFASSGGFISELD